ncbi:peptidoglycan-binding protein [Streptomyces sp. NPDC003781]|uniref:peptidoglycan-binding domain-containing protein n=1 Tax=Streptomyces sp. NPDC003781 TaxID=3364686 RepID=UPI00369FE4D6
MRGYDTYVGDWGDEGVISAGEFPVSNATCLWQHILVAESVAKANGSIFTVHDIDGHFGPNTTYATRKLQVKWGLADSFREADGRVGPNTFGRADDELVKTGGSTARGEVLELRYPSGGSYNVLIRRSALGIYTFKGRDGNWHSASYPKAGASTSCD